MTTADDLADLLEVSLRIVRGMLCLPLSTLPNLHNIVYANRRRVVQNEVQRQTGFAVSKPVTPTLNDFPSKVIVHGFTADPQPQPQKDDKKRLLCAGSTQPFTLPHKAACHTPRLSVDVCTGLAGEDTRVRSLAAKAKRAIDDAVNYKCSTLTTTERAAREQRRKEPAAKFCNM